MQTQWPIRRRVRQLRNGTKVDYVLSLGSQLVPDKAGREPVKRRAVKCFPSERMAKAERARLREEHARLGDMFLALPRDRMQALMRAGEKLSAAGLHPDDVARDVLEACELFGGRATMPSFADLAQFYIDRMPAHGQRKSVRDVYELWLASMAEETEFSPRTIADYRYQVKMLVDPLGPHDNAAVGDRLVTDIRTDELRDRLTLATKRRRLAPRSRDNAIRAWRRLFNYAIEEGWLPKAANPAVGIRRPKLKRSSPPYMALDDVRAFLAAAEQDQKHGQRILLRFCIEIFSGVRPCEAELIELRDVALEERVLIVRDEVATKTGVPRRVTIADNLYEWLRCWWPRGRTRRDRVGLTNKHYWAHIRALRDELGMPPWPGDIRRHTYATYHVAMHGEASRTATQLGHRGGLGILYRHYVASGRVSQADAEAFWSILPAASAPALQVKEAVA